MGILISIIVLCWASIVVIDYYKAMKDQKLIFCISENTKKYDDGTVYECDGVGYKFFKYDRDSVKATEFGPFFIEEKTTDQLINSSKK